MAYLNVGTMTGKRDEIVRLMNGKSIDILCVQENRWKGSQAMEIGKGFKIFYNGDGRRNGVGIILTPSLKD